MQTNFTLQQLKEQKVNTSNEILRKCVHCGFCNATCPTYILRGDELDGPRGRIYLIKEMLETNKPVTAKVVKHIDRCLSCLSCSTTCPASVNYMHLIDHARIHIEKTFKRPLNDRLLRLLLAFILPYPKRFRLALIAGRLARPFANFFPGQLRELILATPITNVEKLSVKKPETLSTDSLKFKRVALLSGCVQQVISPSINEATIRLLQRHGCEVVLAEGAGCCGALVHHLGYENPAKNAAKKNIIAWERAQNNKPFDAIISNASGCGTTLKDYGNLLNNDPKWAKRASKISALSRDISEVLSDLGLKNIKSFKKPKLVYHSACSLQHGQKLHKEPQLLLRNAGFEVYEPLEPHICCGSAGTYSLLQPELATKLQKRKICYLKNSNAELIAAGNIGCISHISQGMDKSNRLPVIHTVELLDWATGGPRPESLP